MATLQNFVVFEGFLGREAPVVRQVTGGKNQPTLVSNFAICWSQSFWNKEKQQLESRNQTWVQVEAWGPVAEQISAANFAPGQQLQLWRPAWQIHARRLAKQCNSNNHHQPSSPCSSLLVGINPPSQASQAGRHSKRRNSWLQLLSMPPS